MLNIPMLALESLIWSLLWMIVVSICVRHFPWSIEHDYPQDVRDAAAIPKPNKEQKKATILFGIISFSLLFLFVILSVLLTYELKSLSLVTIFLHIFIMSMTWNVVDLLVLDCLLICTFKSKFFIFPNTENCAGNKDYGYHFMGFLKGCLTMTLISIFLTALTFGLGQILH